MAALQQQKANGSLTAASLVWSPGMDDWAEASAVDDLASLFVSIEPPPLPAR
jgi:hypothetical protein